MGARYIRREPLEAHEPKMECPPGGSGMRTQAKMGRPLHPPLAPGGARRAREGDGEAGHSEGQWPGRRRPRSPLIYPEGIERKGRLLTVR